MSGSGDAGHTGDRAWMPPNSAATGTTATEQLTGYSELAEVARGGDSVVYRARQDQLGRDVAVKVLLVDDPETAQRFRRELEITVRLGRQHPNIVTVLDTGTTGGGRPCIVMDFFDLGSLDDRLRDSGPLPVSEVVAAGTVVADALSFAHDQGVLHRDVKPQNVLLLPTSYVLADFGIARLVDSAHTASAERFSYRHAAPQVLDGETPSALDDVWSLGSTLHTLLDGRPPFASDDAAQDTALAYLRRVRTEEPRPIQRSDVPAELVAIVRRCLAKDRADRFADAAALREALAAVRTESRAWAPDASADRPATASADESADAPAGTAASAATGESARSASPTAPGSAPEGSGGGGSAESGWAPAGSGAEVGAAAAGGDVHAVSALAHDADVIAADRAPTGRGALADPAEVPDTADKPVRRTPKVVWILAAAALVIGAAAGGLGAWLRRDDKPAANPQPTVTRPSQRPVPTLSGKLPTASTPPPPVFSDPKFAATITDLDDNGSSIRLTWTDPTKGKARYLVVDGQSREVLAQLDPGATTANVSVKPEVRPRCFVITTLLDGRPRAASLPRCTITKGG